MAVSFCLVILYFSNPFFSLPPSFSSRVTPSDITKMRRWEREDGRWKEEGGEEWDDISLGEEGKEKEEKGKEGREEKKLLTYLSFVCVFYFILFSFF